MHTIPPSLVLVLIASLGMASGQCETSCVSESYSFVSNAERIHACRTCAEPSVPILLFELTDSDCAVCLFTSAISANYFDLYAHFVFVFFFARIIWTLFPLKLKDFETFQFQVQEVHDDLVIIASGSRCDLVLSFPKLLKVGGTFGIFVSFLETVFLPIAP